MWAFFKHKHSGKAVVVILKEPKTLKDQEDFAYALRSFHHGTYGNRDQQQGGLVALGQRDMSIPMQNIMFVSSGKLGTSAFMAFLNKQMNYQVELYDPDVQAMRTYQRHQDQRTSDIQWWLNTAMTSGISGAGANLVMPGAGPTAAVLTQLYQWGKSLYEDDKRQTFGDIRDNMPINLEKQNALTVYMPSSGSQQSNNDVDVQALKQLYPSAEVITVDPNAGPRPETVEAGRHPYKYEALRESQGSVIADVEPSKGGSLHDRINRERQRASANPDFDARREDRMDSYDPRQNAQRPDGTYININDMTDADLKSYIEFEERLQALKDERARAAKEKADILKAKLDHKIAKLKREQELFQNTVNLLIRKPIGFVIDAAKYFVQPHTGKVSAGLGEKANTAEPVKNEEFASAFGEGFGPEDNPRNPQSEQIHQNFADTSAAEEQEREQIEEELDARERQWNAEQESYLPLGSGLNPLYDNYDPYNGFNQYEGRFDNYHGGGAGAGDFAG